MRGTPSMDLVPTILEDVTDVIKYCLVANFQEDSLIFVDSMPVLVKF